MSKLLDGKWLSRFVLTRIASEVEALNHKFKKVPGLGVILVGDNPASKTYVASKEKTATSIGFKTFDIRLPATAELAEVSAAIKDFNQNENVDGILLQLPLPKHLDQNVLLDQIAADKDADGLHPLNQGLLMRGGGVLRPCTPSGVMKLIDLALSEVDPLSAEISEKVKIPEASLAGKKAVVIGRSILVGKPVGIMLLERNATVTFAHSRSPNLPSICRDADIVVAAAGVPRMVQGSWIKDGAVVIDVGTNRLSDGALCGDVDFESCKDHCAAISPSPGGVGPMTIAMLLQNTFNSFKRKLEID